MRRRIRQILLLALSALIALGAPAPAMGETSQTATTDMPVTATATALNLGASKSVSIETAGDVRYFSYKPSASGYYRFTGSSQSAIHTFAYDGGRIEIARQRNCSFSSAGYTSRLFHYLESGKQYYFAARFSYFDSTGSLSVLLEKATVSGTLPEGPTWSLDAAGKLTMGGSGAIPDRAFNSGVYNLPWYDMRDLITSVVVQNGVTAIGSKAFEECGALKSVSIGSGVKTIGNFAFSECEELETLALGSAVTTIGDSAFNYCRKLFTLTLPKSVRTVGESAFYFCSRLSAVTLNAGLTSVGDCAFYYCDGMHTLSVPASLTQVGEDAFFMCRGMEQVSYSGTDAQKSAMAVGTGNGYFNLGLGRAVIDSGSCGDKLSWSLSAAGKLTITGSGAMTDYEVKRSSGLIVGSSAPWDDYRHMLTAVSVGSGVTTVGNYAFCDSLALADVTLSDSVTSIGEYAFYETKIRTIKLPSGLKTLGKNCLANIATLLSVDIPESVTTIGTGVLHDSSLYSVSIPRSVTAIPNGMFDATRLADVFYAGTQAQWQAVTVGSYNDILAEACIHYAQDVSTGTASGSCGAKARWKLDQSGVLTISGTGAMEDYRHLDSAEVPSGASYVLSSGTYDGKRLHYTLNTPWWEYRAQITKLVVSPGITHIGDGAFMYCYNAQSVSLPDSVVSIGSQAFGDTNLSSVTLPDSVTTLGSGAFQGCASLRSVRLSSNLTAIPEFCFYECRSLDALTVPAKVTRMESFPDDLESITFLGPLPEKLAARDLLKRELRVFCQARYFDDFRDHMLDYVRSLARDDYKYLQLSTLTTIGGVVPSLSERYYLYLSDTCPSVTLRVSMDGTTDGFSVQWSSSDSSQMTVSPQGRVVAQVDRGAATAIAEVTYNGKRSLAFCTATISTSLYNNKMLDTLPTSGIKANRLATAASLSSPYMYIEHDTSSAYYKEILALTKQLTAGCTGNAEKARAILIWIRDNLTYSMRSLCIGETPGQVYAVYYNREGNCAGFSKLAGFMYALAGIPCAYITNLSHAWNAVLLDGRWVMLDAQYGASAFNADYRDDLHRDISTILFTQGDYIYSVTEPGQVALAGIGEGPIAEYREGFTSISLPSFVTAIGYNALAHCTSLKSVELRKGITSIGDGAFGHCTNLETVTLPEGITSIGFGAFEFCENLKAPALPASLVTIDHQAFGNCKAMTDITVPATVKSIGRFAFFDCKGLKSITVLGRNTEVGEHVFDSCYSAVVRCYKGSPVHAYCMQEGNAFELLDTFSTYLTLPAGLTAIESMSFSGLDSVDVIVIPQSVKAIADDAFSGTDAVLSVKKYSKAWEWAREKGMNFILQ